MIDGTLEYMILVKIAKTRLVLDRSKVEEDGYEEREAIHLAKRLLRDNAIELFLHNTGPETP